MNLHDLDISNTKYFYRILPVTSKNGELIPQLEEHRPEYYIEDECPLNKDELYFDEQVWCAARITSNKRVAIGEKVTTSTYYDQSNQLYEPQHAFVDFYHEGVDVRSVKFKSHASHYKCIINLDIFHLMLYCLHKDIMVKLPTGCQNLDNIALPNGFKWQGNSLMFDSKEFDEFWEKGFCILSAPESISQQIYSKWEKIRYTGIQQIAHQMEGFPKEEFNWIKNWLFRVFFFQSPVADREVSFQNPIRFS